MIVLWDGSAMTVRLILIDGEMRQDYTWEAGRSLARDMLAYLRDRLAEEGRVLADVKGIGVFRGPGSYTGLRIGLTVLNTLATANDAPIVGSTGDDWQNDCLLMLANGDNHKIVLPEYGGEARVTQPRK